MFLKIKILSLLLIIFVTGCGHKGFYSKGYYSGQSGRAPNGVHVVKPGETLYSIAFQHGQDFREIARWNDIDESYTIYPEQRLKLIKPSAANRRPSLFEKKVNKSLQTSRQASSPQVKTEEKASKKGTNSQKLEWRWPASGPILSQFSYSDPGQKGIAIAGRKGTRIYAAEGGYVVYSGSGLRGYGKLIIIKHNETFLSAYAHNDRLHAREGEKVKKGEHIADMGNTGTDRVKLHFEIRRNGTPVNPSSYLPKT